MGVCNHTPDCKSLLSLSPKRLITLEDHVQMFLLSLIEEGTLLMTFLVGMHSLHPLYPSDLLHQTSTSSH